MATLGVQFFNNEADSTLNDNFFLTDTDMFVMQIGEEGSNGIETESSDTITITPSVAPATFATDYYNSTVALNLLITSDGSELFQGKVLDTTTTSFDFLATSMVSVTDGSAGAATDWAPGGAGQPYSWRIHYPSAIVGATFGDYFGHIRELQLEIGEETIQFKKGVPRELIVQDTLEWTYKISGTNFTPNEGVYTAVMNASQYGSQSSQYELHFGFAPSTRKRFKVALIGTNRAGKQVLWEFFICQFTAAGTIGFSAEEYKGLPFSLDVFKDPLRGNGRNAARLQVDE